jgi:hypothetical protein
MYCIELNSRPLDDPTVFYFGHQKSYRVNKGRGITFNILSHKTLKLGAATIWTFGGLVLLLKGASLLTRASGFEKAIAWPLLALVSGFIFGGIKAKFIFTKNCQKNLERIEKLDNPKFWQFFRPRFFAFLAAMILTGTILSRLAMNNYSLLIAVATLDISIATALLASSRAFWGKVCIK